MYIVVLMYNLNFIILIDSTELHIQSNSTMLALYGGEEDRGDLYTYELDRT